MEKGFYLIKFKAYIDLLRPFTLLAPLIVSCCIMIASYYYNGINDDLSVLVWSTILPAGVCLALLNGASNSLNQATDVVSDRISKPYRPVPRGVLSVKEVKIISLLLYVVTLTLSIAINWTFFFFVLIISFFTITYSIKPRMKDVLFVNQLWVAIPRGFLGVLVSWSVFGSIFNPVPLSIGLISMFFLFGGSITKDVADSYGDKKAGTKTLVNTFGIQKAAVLSLPFMFFPFAFIPLFINFGILDVVFFPLTFFAISGFLIFHLMVNKNIKLRFFENVSAWSMMYITYFLFASSFSVIVFFSYLS